MSKPFTVRTFRGDGEQTNFAIAVRLRPDVSEADTSLSITWSVRNPEDHEVYVKVDEDVEIKRAQNYDIPPSIILIGQIGPVMLSSAGPHTIKVQCGGAEATHEFEAVRE